MLSKGSISSKIFKDILEEVLTSNLSVEEILKEKNIKRYMTQLYMSYLWVKHLVML